MKTIFTLLTLLFAIAAQAQDVSTSFTLDTPTANCIAVLTQDGAPASGAVCPSGFFGGAGLQIWLQNDPIAPGQSLSLYGCATSVMSNTVPPYGTATQSPPGSLVTAITCTGTENWYTPTWTGTLTYNYVSALRRRCSGGRGAHCVTNFVPVWASGSGALTTPQPPPPPPPPPPPIVTTIAIAGGVCDANASCVLEPASGAVITGATLDLVGLLIGVGNADGSALTGTVDSWTLTPSDDDRDEGDVTYALSAQGTLYNADGSLFGTYDLQLTALMTDSGSLIITSGTLTETQ
jgi:hypothetical protein